MKLSIRSARRIRLTSKKGKAPCSFKTNMFTSFARTWKRCIISNGGLYPRVSSIFPHVKHFI
uniref:Uncharacterized protein n=1 Tax=Parascaris univalens TaxID=6257 RepID=A0A915AYC8_PARUN